jgi:hypothetical protein
MRVEYADTCEIHNTDRGKIMIVEVLDFQPQKKLVVSVQRSVKVTLTYDEFHKVYIGSMAGMEFTSNGPQEFETRGSR